MNGRRLVPLVVLLLLAVAGCGGAATGEPGQVVVRVAAASSLNPALDEVADAVAAQHPDISVDVVYGSSGAFVAQIANGAPFDLYLAADLEHPQRLVEQDLAEADELFSYAVGRLVVWTPEGSPVDPAAGLAVLADERLRTVAIANPQHAPYGVAAVAAMQDAGVYDVVQDKLVLGENVAQAAEFVQSGNADAGIVAMSVVRSPALRDVGRWSEVPPEAFPRLEQGGLVLPRARDAEAARAVRDTLLGRAGRGVLERHGFLPAT